MLNSETGLANDKLFILLSSPKLVLPIQEHKIVKQMLGALLHQNGVLKRAFLIQHNRLKEYQEMVEERSQFNQILENYQKQIKALEVGFVKQ